ncbi:MAG TPA: YhcH/YjgK/YiaL family protein [Candidatus Andersenbacteria bacterium]|nr:YhcH/YjgK/YiaL family protein [Candidatus Andersenbacteria bacterium]
MLLGYLNQPKTFAPFLKHSAWGKALTWIREHHHNIPDDGEYPILGQEMRALVQTVRVKPEAERAFESHQQFFDLQYCFTGGEHIGWAPTSILTVSTEYDKARDVALYTVPTMHAVIHVRRGAFAIFLEDDGHLPGLTGDGVRKVVIKIHRDLLSRSILLSE